MLDKYLEIKKLNAQIMTILRPLSNNTWIDLNDFERASDKYKTNALFTKQSILTCPT